MPQGQYNHASQLNALSTATRAGPAHNTNLPRNNAFAYDRLGVGISTSRVGLLVSFTNGELRGKRG